MNVISTILLLLTLSCTSALSDVLFLKNGQIVTGTIIQEDAKGVRIKLDYGTFTYPKSLIKETRTAPEPIPGLPSPKLLRLPSWERVLSKLGTNSWARSITQIPATVIGMGILRNVPYYSFRADSGGYEINVYGDPDAPAGVEVGVRTFRLNDSAARRNCVIFVCSILSSEADAAIVRKLNLEHDSVTSDGLTFEVTPPTEPDAFGGWWVSMYDASALDKSRATPAELKEISQPIVASGPATQTATDSNAWSGTELSNARRSSSGGGSVYVRGYFRKNGTFVRAHTRRR